MGKSTKSQVLGLIPHQGIENHFVSFLLVLVMLRKTVPDMKYLFFPYLGGMIAVILWRMISQKDLRLIIVFLRTYFPLIILIVFFILGLLRTQSISIGLIKEFGNSFSVILIGFVLLFFIRTASDLEDMIRILIKQVILISAIIAILGLVKLDLLLRHIILPFLIKLDIYPEGSSLVLDGNFFSLFSFYGIIFLIPRISRKNTRKGSLIIQGLLLLYSANIFFTASRRGIFVLVCFLVILSAIICISLFNKKRELINIRANSQWYIFSFLLFTIIMYTLMFSISPAKKNRLIMSLGYSPYLVQSYLTDLGYSHMSIISGSTDYDEIFSRSWGSEFDPRYPYSGWGTNVYKLENPLTGDNVAIVPAGSVGYKVDKSTISYDNMGNAQSITIMREIDITPDRVNLASIYCYVSEDFDADRIRISARGGSEINPVRGDTYCDLNLRESWQKLDCMYEGDSGKVTIFLLIEKIGVSSLTAMKGNVIFAHPEFSTTVFNPLEPRTWATVQYGLKSPLTGENVEYVPENAVAYQMDRTANSWTGDKVSYSTTKIGQVDMTQGQRYFATIYCQVSKDFSGDRVRISARGKSKGSWARDGYYDMNEKGSWQKLNCIFIGGRGPAPITLTIAKDGVRDFSSLNGSVLFAYPEYGMADFNPLQPNTWATRQYKEVFRLRGENVEIVPGDARGYLIDRDSRGTSYGGNSYSVTTIIDTILREGDHISASVFCYVSEDFNGDHVRIESRGRTAGSREVYYDLNRKGIWQELTLTTASKHGAASINLRIAKSGFDDFKKVNGNVIFAAPTYRVMRNQESRAIINKLPGPLVLEGKMIFGSFSVLGYLMHVGLKSVNDSVQYGDPSVQTEDYNLFLGPRLDRWKYAWWIYTKEYSWNQRIIGGGFDYMGQFGRKFFNNPSSLDWPHNPFISVLLYSGVLGLLAYFWVFVKVFKIYYRTRKKYGLFFLSFLVTYIFAFFSANSPLDPSVLGLFIVLPFYFHHVERSNKETK